MSGAEALAVGGLDEAAGERLARREGDRVDDDVEAVPLVLEAGEGLVDLLVEGHVHRQDGLRSELGAEVDDAILDAVVLVGEGQLGAFALHGPRDAPGDGPFGGESDDQGLLSGQESHGRVLRLPQPP